MISPFGKWISEHNPENAKAFWDYIEILQRIQEKFSQQISLEPVGSFEVRSPPPEETLTFPSVEIWSGSVK